MERKRMLKWTILWLLAILITLSAIVYQNLTGPTHPRRVSIRLTNQEYTVKLPRSHGGTTDCKVDLAIPEPRIQGEIFFRRFPTQEAWQSVPLIRQGDKLTGMLPHQPPAGKLEYHLLLREGGKVYRLPYGETVVIRFRGDVPAGILIPHVIGMFLSMLLSNLVLLLALFNFRQYRLYAWITTILLLFGGMILGPLVQYHAFGQLWTGFPLGYDLTDNKTLIAFIGWIIALTGNLRKERRYLIIAASLVMLVIFSIPHSARGSELDPATGKIKTGMVFIRPVQAS